ncbi:MAG: glycine betaine ABC transporter substrate-binding protein [Methanohalobium sp.]|uniref:glycine betaine ABC transporter substrate-binding protein n=1 Tax=Methanohalobium sp. TaxID=2837493 RepID=UPI00397AAA10
MRQLIYEAFMRFSANISFAKGWIKNLLWIILYNECYVSDYNNKIKSLLVIGLVLILATDGVGCATDQGSGTEDDTNDNCGTETEDNSVSIAYVQWDDAIATTNVVEQVFEKNGYEVEMTL